MMRGRCGARRLVTGLGVFAALFHAVLFGWHHHEPRWAGHLPRPIVENPGTVPQAGDDADGCEICQVLHHLPAVPVDIAETPLPAIVAASPVAMPAPAFGFVVLAFHARAPPRLDAAVG